MRPDLSPETLELLEGGHYDIHWSVEVANGSGTLVDLSDRLEYIGGSLPSPDQPIASLDLEFLREPNDDGGISLAPFMGASELNRLDDESTYSALLQVGRGVVAKAALTARGGARPGSGFYEIFRGRVGRVGTSLHPDGRGNVAVSCLDMSGALQKTKSEVPYTYEAGSSIETAIQAVLDNNGGSSITLDCPVPTGKVLAPDYEPGVQKTVWEQVWGLAQSIGWVLWWRYREGGTAALTLFEPDREKKDTSDFTFPVIRQISDLDVDENEIFNVGWGEIVDADGVRRTVGPVEDEESIAKYGDIRRSFWVVEDEDSPVRTEEAMLDLLTAAVSDTSEPDAVQSVTMPAFLFGEVSIDRYTFPANDRTYDDPQLFAPFSISFGHRIGEDHSGTMETRGRPTAGAKVWRGRGGPGRPVQSPFGTAQLRFDSEGNLRVTFSGDDAARSFGFRLSNEPPVDEADDEPTGLTIVNGRSGVVDVDPGDFSLADGGVAYLTGWFFRGEDGAGGHGRRVLDQAAPSVAPPPVLILRNFREVELLTEEVRYEWEPSAAVHEVWVYVNTFAKPVPSDPWPTNEVDRQPDYFLPAAVTEFVAAVPPENHKTYLQFEPRDAALPPRAGQIERATIDGIPTTALPRIEYVGQAPATTPAPQRTNVVAVVADPQMRAGRLYAWLNRASPDEADPTGAADGYIDLTTSPSGVRSVTAADSWNLTAGGTANLFQDLVLHAQYGKRIWLRFDAEDGESSGQVDSLLRTWHQVIVGATGEWVDEIVTQAAVAHGAIGTLQLDDDAVTRQKIVDEAINAAKLGANAVETAKIADAAIEAGKIAASAVTEEKIASLAVTVGKIADSAVGTAKIANAAVEEAKLAALAVSEGKIAALAITAGKIAAGAVIAEKIATGAVTTIKLDALAVTTEKLAAGAVTAAKIEALTITAAQIAASTITGAKIAALTIETGNIAAGAITTAKLDALAVTTETIAADAVTAAKINVDTLEEIAPNLGIIISGELRNAAGTHYLNLDAGANQGFLVHPGLTLYGPGSSVTATFSGTITAGTVVSGAIIQASNIAGPWGQTEVGVVIANGAITAAKLSIAELADIQADLGIIVSGLLRNTANSHGIRIADDRPLPGTWTSFLDLGSAGGNPLLKTPHVSINFDGSGSLGTGFSWNSSGDVVLSGALSAATGTFAGTVSAGAVVAAESFSAPLVTVSGALMLAGGRGATHVPAASASIQWGGLPDISAWRIIPNTALSELYVQSGTFSVGTGLWTWTTRHTFSV